LSHFHPFFVEPAASVSPSDNSSDKKLEENLKQEKEKYSKLQAEMETKNRNFAKKETELSDEVKKLQQEKGRLERELKLEKEKSGKLQTEVLFTFSSKKPSRLLSSSSSFIYFSSLHVNTKF
jgi:Skp family chaperone for outer membrane proteins